MTTEKKVSTKVTSASPTKNVTTSKPIGRSPARRRAAVTKTAVKRVAIAESSANKPEATSVRASRSANAVGDRETVTTKQIVANKKANNTKKLKLSKIKMERDSFTMPKDEYAQFAILKDRLETLGQPAKKSELLRAGIKLLSAMTDIRLKATMAAVPVIKTGRPKKKK